MNLQKFKLRFFSYVLIISFMITVPVRANAFGMDIVVLIKMLANSIEQLIQLRQIFTNGRDTVGIMRDINRGISDGLSIIQIINPRFNPGLYGNLDQADQVLSSISRLYGVIPQTSEYSLQENQDRSAAESIAMNGTLFRYADQVDNESRRIIVHARTTNPQGAAKLTAQSIAVLIGVTTQVLRTNSMMLKMMGENMALSNRREKLQAAQFKTQYENLSNSLRALPKDTNLKPLGSF